MATKEPSDKEKLERLWKAHTDSEAVKSTKHANVEGLNEPGK